MKLLLFFLYVFSFSFSYAQDTTAPRVLKDTLFTTSGFKIIVGQEIKIGTGSTPDGDFKFIRRNSSGFGTLLAMTDNNAYNKSELSLQRAWSGHKAKVVKIVTRGNKKTGMIYQPLISLNTVRFEIDLENAITAGEIVVPDEYKPKPKSSVVEIKQQVSQADELKKWKDLYDSGTITKDEYEVKKKKILEQ